MIVDMDLPISTSASPKGEGGAFPGPTVSTQFFMSVQTTGPIPARLELRVTFTGQFKKRPEKERFVVTHAEVLVVGTDTKIWVAMTEVFFKGSDRNSRPVNIVSGIPG